mgnify:CR=1 FL=1
MPPPQVLDEHKRGENTIENPEYMENIYEQFFFLKYSGGWSLTESYNLPIGLRKWFVERLLKQIKAENEAIENAS